MLSRPLAIAVTILVSVVWAANMIIGAIYPEAHDPAINAIFAVVAGAALGLTPKRQTLQAARRRLSRLAGDAPPGEDPGPDSPPGRPGPAQGDGS